ncbi:amino acid permease [Desulfovibrio litoralis]|uniref:Arginine:ornithine antiporter, APA family n=1 Tax=Desulfovibrio litoralis DSM 11393 TaxID=1121455 RepID=A0A1M7S9Z0_9BACT|nr:amino acid permease [Desulfovibrio litoralis]SHN55283.1 arginine:ornithine antiporter, APA family [Desulfovibrio litoralis DSM 11393]
MSSSAQKLSLNALIALVVGSMIGAGVFSLPATFARATGVAGALIAWTIAGTGMLMLAFVFQTLAQRKPDLDSGVFSYAQAGFGNYMGFAAALGFWAGSCVGNVSYFVLIKSTLGGFFPDIFGDGNTVTAVVISSMILWGFHVLILRGVKEAATINTIATIAKIVPIGIFLLVALFNFKTGIFSDNFLGYFAAAITPSDDLLLHLNDYGHLGHAEAELIREAVATPTESLFSQVRGTMLVTVFVFLGIEGASVYSRYAKDRKDVGVATVLGFLGVLLTFVLITLLSYGVMTRAELAGLRQPSMALVLERMVGAWGAIFISVGLIISVLGAYLSWTLLAAEVLFSAAKSKVFPAALTRENENQVPAAALWLTNIFIQGFLILTYFVADAFTLALELTSALSLIPYFLVAAYGVKLASTAETYNINPENRNKDLIIACIATFYSALMLYSGGMKYILLAALIYAPTSLLFFKARQEQKLPIFATAFEKATFGVIVVGAVVAIYSIATGLIRLQ